MILYRVTGPGFHVGPGLLMLLADKDVRDRRHRLADIKPDVAGFALARAVDVQAFIVGTVLGLDEQPRGSSAMLAEIDEESKSPAERAAVAALKAFAVRMRREQEADRNAREQAARIAAEEAAVLADQADQRRWIEEWDGSLNVREQFADNQAKFLEHKRAERAAQQPTAAATAA